MNHPLAQKTILVTGASSGIGRAACRELASRGAEVILLARNEDGLRETMSTMPKEKCLPLSADLRDIPSLPDVLRTAWDWKGKIDGCVFCAGIGGRARLRDTSVEFMTDLMLVNCFSFVELVRILAKFKKKVQLMQVAAISSFAALGHDKYFLAYSASKAALEACAKTLAAELCSRRTLVNIIRAAYVDTPMISGNADILGDFGQRLEESGYQPLGIISPVEIAKMAAYLMGPAALHISGAIIPINAGVSC